jgi:hypothetical protein
VLYNTVFNNNNVVVNTGFNNNNVVVNTGDALTVIGHNPGVVNPGLPAI